VNLRPLLQKEGREKSEERKRNRREEHRTTADLLAEAMVESARRVKGDQIVMRRRLAAAVRWCRRKLPRQAAELERIAVRAGESGYPAFHHSPAYKRAYRPAYRVILKSCLDPSVKSNRQGRTRREARDQAEGRSQKLDVRSVGSCSALWLLASRF